MKNIASKNGFTCAASAFAIAVVEFSGATPAYAASDTGEQSGIEEIIVTAEKRSESIQRTPIAMSALSGDDLADRQITGVEALLAAVPNVDFGMGLSQARISIRGIGYDNISGGNEARIAFHQDGVYYSRPVSVASGFFDVERVEVLRGPQGTLYGRNATGGVVNVITRAPGDSLNARFSVTGSNYNRVRLEAAIGAPLAEGISARIAAQYENRDGYGVNEITGDNNVEDKNFYAVRGKLLIEPSDDFSILLVGDYSREKDHANGYQFIRANPETNPFVPAALAPVPRPLTGELFGGIAPSKPRNQTGEQTQNFVEVAGINATMKLNKWDLDFVSITGYRDVKYKLFSEIDQTSAPIATIFQSEKSKQFSQEFRVSQSSDEFDWMLGGYYFTESLETGNQVAENLAVTPLFNPVLPTIACGGAPCTAADLDPRGYTQMFDPYGSLDTDSWAIFGNVHYRITDALGLRMGLRYGWEKKTVFNQSRTNFGSFNPPPWDSFPLPSDTCGPVPAPACTLTEQRASQTYKSLTPSITVDYQPTKDIYLYATYAHGMKSGGFNVGNPQPPFTKEKIVNYEIGAKIDWFDHRLRTNVSTFYYDYKDIQSTIVSGIPPRIEILNAPGARQYGLELEAIAEPVDNLRFNLDFAWLESEYKGPFLSWDTSLPWVSTPGLDGDPLTPGVQPTTDQAGNQLVYAPKYTFGFGAEYDILLNGWKLTLRGETKYKANTFLTIFNRSYVAQPSFWKSNAYLTLAREGEDFSIQAFVQNIENNTTISAANVGPSFWGAPIYGAFAPPRTYGLQLSYSY